MPRPYRLAFGSCSHPSLPQPLWPIITSRHPTAFIWGGDAIYADRYAGLNWTAVGLHHHNNDEWKITFPPPSVHLEATPNIIRDWYEKQLNVEGYQQFLDGFDIMDIDNKTTKVHSRPVIFGTIDDHDYGMNNGDITYQYKRESNLAFMDFIYGGLSKGFVEGKEEECTLEENGPCDSTKDNEGSSINNRGIKGERRSKHSDPMYQRALDGKGVYGVQLFDFSREANTNDDDGSSVWGGGHWVSEHEAMIDPDVIDKSASSSTDNIVNYSTTNSVAVFALDVRSNKTPWPKGRHHHNSAIDNSAPKSGNLSLNIPTFDFLGAQQWEWFQSALANSQARVNIIVSGLQVHTDRFPNDGNVVEEWAKFAESRDMLYDMILNSGVKSPLLISGDVHMSQFLRKDCIRSSDVQKWDSETKTEMEQSSPPKRSLIEITTSGMTHSWGTSFSSQPKHHTWPLWPYSYLVSRTFMTICHFICPWNEIIVRKMGNSDDAAQLDGPTGKQFYLGLNFAEIEFDFTDDENDLPDSGALTVRIFGKKGHEPPKLESRWTFDQLSGLTNIEPEMTAKLGDFVSSGMEASDWICVPYRGLPSAVHYYAAIAIQFVVFCTLFFLPYIVLGVTFLVVRKQWQRPRMSSKPVAVDHDDTGRNGGSNGHYIRRKED